MEATKGDVMWRVYWEDFWGAYALQQVVAGAPGFQQPYGPFSEFQEAEKALLAALPEGPTTTWWVTFCNVS
jgi:hypothetical protein